ncbi:MAG: tryptophan-rich sensory protein [Clostridia bacterium]|nr:tryptophan-rich sensory protein [Clostridia bacterium]
MQNIKIFIKSIAIPLLLGILVGVIISGSMDYEILEKPFLAPPGWLFPIVWTILYILMGVSYGILENKGLDDSEVKSIYYAQLITNLLWPIAFFVFKWRFFAFLWILLLLGLIIKMVVEFYKKDKLAGLLQIPYLIWTTFATYLNLAVYLLNR